MREKLCTTIIFYTEHFVVPFFLLNSLVAEKIKSLYIFFKKNNFLKFISIKHKKHHPCTKSRQILL